MALIRQQTIAEAATFDHVWLQARHRFHDFRKAGLKPGEIILDPSQNLNAMANLLAAMMGQFIYVPIPAGFTDFECSDPLTSDIRALVSTSAQMCHFRWSDTFASIPRIPCFQVALKTSGSESGSGRWVLLSAEAMLHQLASHHEAMPSLAAEQDRLISLPGFHSFGLILDRLLGLYSRQNLIFCPDPRDMIHLLTDNQDVIDIRMMALVPRQIAYLFEKLEAMDSLTQLSTLNLHTGGAPLSTTFRTMIQDRLQSLHIGYGLTECGPGVLLNGKPVGCDVHLMALPENSQLFSLEVKTPSLGLMAEKHRKMNGDYFQTNDLAVRGQQGIEVIGRASDMIKTQAGTWLHLQDLRLSIGHILDSESFSLSIKHDLDQPELSIRILTTEKTIDATRQRSLENFVRKTLHYNITLWIPLDYSALAEDLEQNQLQHKGKSVAQMIASLSEDYFQQVA